MTVISPVEARANNWLVDCLRKVVAEGYGLDAVRQVVPKLYPTLIKLAIKEELTLARHEGREAERAAFERLTKVAHDVATRFATHHADDLRAQLLAQGQTVAEVDRQAKATFEFFYSEFVEQVTTAMDEELERPRN